MIDVGLAGNPFTWNNNRKGVENIKERLDRGLASPTWVHLHPDACLPNKLSNTKLALLKWNSLHFGNIHKKIKETLNLIDSIQQAPPSSSSFEQEISLKLDLENLLVKEKSL